MFLVDTNVISSVAPSKGAKPGALAEWLDEASDWLYFSTVTAAEVRSGIAKAIRLGAHRKAASLHEWWSAIEHLFGERFIPFDLAAAHVAARMIDLSRAHEVGFEDIAIAATAETHGLIVLTQNERHFRPLGVPLHNPMKSLPALPARNS